jgi:excisionase family DNA binding protein
MEQLLLIDKNDLREILKELIPTATVVEPMEKEKDFLPLDEALAYINGRGLKISKETIYKLTSLKQIPFQRWGGRKIVFERDKLDEWLEARLSCDEEKRTNRITNHVAKAARKKERA